MPFKVGTSAYILHRLKKVEWGIMAKSVRRRGRKGAARKAPVTAKRKTAQLGVTPGKIRALVYNLSTQELDELIKVAIGRKNGVMATARASFLDEVKTRAASLGMSLADLVGLGSGKAAGKKAYVAGSRSPAKNTEIPKPARPGLGAAGQRDGSPSWRRRGANGTNLRSS